MSQQSLVPLKAMANPEVGLVRLQRKCACEASGETCSRCSSRKKTLQRKSSKEPALISVPPIVNDVLASSGQPIDSSTRAFMEERFGHDFSDVRIHTDSYAAASARSVDALAYTVGWNVAFDAGQYAPHTTKGRELLAHELSHVVQQSFVSLSNSSSESQLESEADVAAQRVSDGELAPQLGSTNKVLARKSKSGNKLARQMITLKDQPGQVAVFYDGALVATINYKVQVGRVETSSSQGKDGNEWITVVTPAGSDATLSVTPQYTQLYEAGRLALSDIPPDYDFDKGEEYVGRTFHISAKAEQNAAPTLEPHPKAPISPVKQSVPAQLNKDIVKPLEKSPDQLIKESSTLNFLDEEKLGKNLLKYALAGDMTTVDVTLDEIDSTDRDDVALGFVSHATTEQLAKLAETEQGRKLLLRLYDELTSGHLGNDEKEQAERLMQARTQRTDPSKFIEADKKAMIIPFSSIGFTKLSSASLTVNRLHNGKIWVKSHMKVEHWKDAKNLPTKDFALGLDGVELDPDEVIGLHLYDEGGKVVYVPAIYLLQLGNQEDTKAYSMMGEAVFTGLTLGFGGAATAGGEATTGIWASRGLTALKWADRTATTVGVASTLINDHRGLILEYLGKDGEEYLSYWQKVETVVAIYGLARGAVALGQTTAALRTSIKNMRVRKAQLKLKGVSAKDETALENVIKQSEKTLDELESAEKTAAKSGSKSTGEISSEFDDVATSVTDSRSGGGLVDNVTPETKRLYEAKPELKSALERNQLAAAALKKCKSPCFPDYATEEQIERIQKLLEAVENSGQKIPQEQLAGYFRSADSNLSLKTIEERRSMLNKLIDGFSDYRKKFPAYQRQAEKEFKSFQKAFPGTKSEGDLIQLGEHGGASRNREELGLSGKEYESAHLAAQSVMKQMPEYDPKPALTRLLERTNHRGTEGLDHFWKKRFDEMRKARPDKKATGKELYDILAEAIESTKGIPEGERKSLIARLWDEMFKEGGVIPEKKYIIPRGYLP